MTAVFAQARGAAYHTGLHSLSDASVMNETPTSTEQLHVVPLRRTDFLRLLLRRDKPRSPF
ncbi:hypothetical protein HA44_20770 [Mixta gaviniae]|nr:hypothetical protein HA44_20770 [Mixta gaviniae]